MADHMSPEDRRSQTRQDADHDTEQAYDPDERVLTLKEVKSILGSLQTREEMLTQSQPKLSQRMVGWFLNVVIMSMIAWGLLYQYSSVESLRHTQYEACLVRNQQVSETRDFYRSISVMFAKGDANFLKLLNDQIALTKDVDCSKFR